MTAFNLEDIKKEKFKQAVFDFICFDYQTRCEIAFKCGLLRDNFKNDGDIDFTREVFKLAIKLKKDVALINEINRIKPHYEFNQLFDNGKRDDVKR